MSKDQRSRPVVVCLHGSAGNSHMWRALVDMVRDRCTILTPAIDLSAGGDLQSVAEQVLLQVGASASRFHVVGHAYGGAVALQLAQWVPERVASLVLYEPSAAPGIDAAILDMPVRLLCGTRSWPVARRIIDGLRRQLADASLLQLVGLRHMAPLTHPHLINPVILDHILPDVIPEFFGPCREGGS